MTRSYVIGLARTEAEPAHSYYSASTFDQVYAPKHMADLFTFERATEHAARVNEFLKASGVRMVAVVVEV